MLEFTTPYTFLGGWAGPPGFATDLCMQYYCARERNVHSPLFIECSKFKIHKL